VEPFAIFGYIFVPNAQATAQTNPQANPQAKRTDNRTDNRTDSFIQKKYNKTDALRSYICDTQSIHG
jgi:hypothetical protein